MVAISPTEVLNATKMVIAYLNDVKTANEDQKRLFGEIQATAMVLAELENHAKEEDWKETMQYLSATRGPFEQLRQELKDMETKLNPHSGRISRTWKALKWYFSKDDIKKHFDSIERIKKLIQTALQSNQMFARILVFTNSRKLEMSKKKDLEEIQKDTKYHRTQLEGEQNQKIVQWLSNLNFWAKQDDVFERHQEGTGEWFLRDPKFQGWINGEIPVLWCPGDPGVGKTILASIAIHHLESLFANKEDIAIACVYFDHKRAFESVSVLQSILQHVAQRKSPISEAIQGLYNKHISRKTVPPLIDVCETLKLVMREFRNIFVVMDAIDECLSGDASNTIRQVLEELQKLQPKIRMMITGRPFAHNHMSRFDVFETLNIRARNSDVEKFAHRQIEVDDILQKHACRGSELEKLIIETVVSKANGMFLIARLHMKLLSGKLTENEIRESLNNLSDDRDSVYKDVMNRILNQKGSLRTIATTALIWITYAKKELTSQELLHAVAVDLKPRRNDLNNGDLIDINTLLSSCVGLVIANKDGIIRLVHETTQGYLEERLPESEANTSISKTGLAYLNFDVFEIPCEGEECLIMRKEKYKLAEYISEFWGVHANDQIQNDEEIKHLVFQDFGSPMRRKAISQFNGEPVLHNIARYGLAKICAFLLNKIEIEKRFLGAQDSVDVMERDKGGSTALHIAAKNGHIQVAKLLIDQEVNVNAVDHEKRTPMHWAAWGGHKLVVGLLLAKGGKVNSKDKCGMTAWHLAARQGHKDVVKLLFDVGFEAVARGKAGWSQLHEAAWGGHEDMVALLLDKGADYAGTTEDGSTALHLAGWQGHKDVVALLLDKGADVAAKNKDLWMVLHSAAWSGHKDVVALLLDKGADVTAKNKDLWTALHAAAWGGHKDVVALLLDNGADIAAQNKDLWTALHSAAWIGHKDVVALLLDKGANVAAKSKDLSTALHEAAWGGHKDVAALLLYKGADVTAERDDGWTALHVAAFGGHEDVVLLLLDKGADVAAKTKENRGSTALHLAALGGHKDMAFLLLDKGADITEKNNYGLTALHHAATEGHSDVVVLLLDKGADVDETEGDGSTALHRAATKGHKDVVALLLDKGVDVTTTDSRGFTALRWAAEKEHKDVVALLERALEKEKNRITETADDDHEND